MNEYLAGSSLTNKQMSFCLEYTLDFNGKRAAIRAGYSVRTSMEQASRLLRNVKVKNEIQRLRTEIVKKIDVRVEDILSELELIAFSDITEFINYKKGKLTLHIPNNPTRSRRAIRIIQQSNNGFTIKMYNKQTALFLLGKYFGLY